MCIHEVKKKSAKDSCRHRNYAQDTKFVLADMTAAAERLQVGEYMI